MMAGERSNATDKKNATANEKNTTMGKGNAATKGRNAAEDGRRSTVGKRKTAADGKNVTTREKNATVGRRRAVEKEKDAAMDERSNATDKRNSATRGKNATAGKGDAIEKGRDAAAGERRVTAGKKRAAVGESNAFPNVLFHFLEKMGVGRDTFSLFLFTFARKHRTLGASKVLAGINNSPHFTHKIDIKPHNLMKRTHTFQLKALTFLLLSFCFLTAQAQRKFRFGLGINYALPIERYTSGETRLGVYLNGTYRLADRLDVGLTASLDEPSYAIHEPDGTVLCYETYALSFVPNVTYAFPLKTPKVLPFVGMGLGVSFDNIKGGVFSDGHKLHPVAVPMAGVRFFKHIDLVARYYITDKKFDRLTLSLGYTF